MKLIDTTHSDRFEKIYNGMISAAVSARERIYPYIRRVIRFMALPYVYLRMIDWTLCPIPRLRVMYDLVYIFFKYKYYPDNYFMCKLWEKDREDWPRYYGSIYDPYQRYKMQRSVLDKCNIVLFENKLICYQLCAAGGFPLPRQYALIKPTDDFRSQIRHILDSENSTIILKPFDGQGGKGIVVAYRDGDKYLVKSNKNHICDLDEFVLNRPVVVQEFVDQHPYMKQFSTSVNTVRVVTMLTERNDVILIGSFVRFGLNNSNVDNLSSGGIAAGVNVATGEMYESAISFNGREYLAHPSTGKEFKGCRIPRWDTVVELSERVQRYFFYHKMLGIDICMTEEGPLIIELNAEPDMIALEMTYGPILSRREVWTQFNKYDLLINNAAKCLYT